jgi:small subunit ribosomal protein S8
MNINLIKFLLKLKNASFSQKENVTVDFNKLNLNVARELYNQGLIQSFRINSQKDSLTVVLRYFYNKPVLRTLQLLSKPSHVKYVRYSDICRVPDKKFIFFLSTSEGVLTNLECKQKKMGGKLLFMC